VKGEVPMEEVQGKHILCNEEKWIKNVKQ